LLLAIKGDSDNNYNWKIPEKRLPEAVTCFRQSKRANKIILAILIQLHANKNLIN